MLSDEEKKAIDKLKRSANYFVMPIYETKIILELIEKQSKEIEELKQEKEYLNCIIESDKDNYINKDKIKAKIEEYKKQIEKMEKDDNGIGFTLGKEWSDLKAKVEFGQSLLEKE